MTAFTLPTPTDFINGIGAWASPLFSEMLPISMFDIGLIAAASMLVFIIIIFERALSWFLGRNANKYE